ncbi:uncharacterized protein LY79DRAFT_562832 [Colletotrichum navitas]|uniref:Uncharacterized protein n=1 Tax=Colletotrichum navitas TaxID=681940 RepID=A0AAD8V049_9PEZI|nr:uncharacterized protein LY79DRAFT_562832 [Colletotrichum navitas]KAK1579920.1 hypothetical protein LY79DRAFT_562832 [Colletotrichum navitas]
MVSAIPQSNGAIPKLNQNLPKVLATITILSVLLDQTIHTLGSEKEKLGMTGGEERFVLNSPSPMAFPRRFHRLSGYGALFEK